MHSPDFLITPYALIEDPEVTPLDERVYSIIYWFTKLKNERCYASNPALAQLAKTSAKTVGNSLDRLEKLGYIKRLFSDEKRRSRTEIIPLVVMGRVPSGDGRVPSGSGTEVPSGDGQKKNNLNKNKELIAQPSADAVDNSASPSRTDDPNAPMTVTEFVDWMDASPSRHCHVVAWWAELSQPTCATRGQWKEFTKRNLRPARSLSPFTNDQLVNGYQRMRDSRDEKKGFLTDYTLETILKYVIR